MAKKKPATTTGNPGRKARKKRQQKAGQYMRMREELQLEGRIATTPEGATRDETVDPAVQGEQQIPQLVRQALRENWAVPDAAKPAIVGRLLEPFYQRDKVALPNGEVVEIGPDRNLLKENAKVLVAMDQRQWERDHPEEAGRARGGVKVNIDNQVNVIDQHDWSLILQGLTEVPACEVERQVTEPLIEEQRDEDQVGSDGREGSVADQDDDDQGVVRPAEDADGRNTQRPVLGAGT